MRVPWGGGEGDRRVRGGEGVEGSQPEQVAHDGEGRGPASQIPPRYFPRPVVSPVRWFMPPLKSVRLAPGPACAPSVDPTKNSSAHWPEIGVWLAALEL
jgi:hypothetical protein